jgi:hypothetical protein
MSTPTTIHGPSRPSLLALRGIRLIEGEEGAAPAAPAEPAPGGEPAAPAAPAAPTGSAWDGKVESLDPAVQKMITDLRTEAAASRVAKNTEQERVQAILAAAGIKTDDADPVEAAKRAAAERDAAVATAAETARKLAIFTAAAGAGADPAKLLDSLTFTSSVKDIDPSDGAAIAAAITAAVQANPTLKAARAAGVSGTDFSGSGEQGQITEEQLARMTPEQIVDAQSKGLLSHLL